MRNLTFALFLFSTLNGENVSLEVPADGTPTKAIDLKLSHKYQIKVTGAVNLGKYWEGNTVLADDACYELIAKTGKATSPLKNFRNSLDINVCEEKYREDHTYTSKTFVAKQSKIHFWIDDIDYSDNSGSLHIEIIEIK